VTKTPVIQFAPAYDLTIEKEPGMATVLMVIATVIMVAVFGALYWWSCKSERDISYDKPGLSDEQANALRFGIAIGANQGQGGM
jgi:hypothetical protein